MAKPLTTVTPKNFYNVHRYFRRLFERGGLYGPHSTGDEFKADLKARRAFSELSKPAYTEDPAIKEESEKSAAQALQVWIQEHAKQQWPKFLALERQRKFRKKERVRGLWLQSDTYFLLTHYAKKAQLSLNSALEHLVKTELDRLQNLEWEQKHGNNNKANY